jgi:hypothetical protein
MLLVTTHGRLGPRMECWSGEVPIGILIWHLDWHLDTGNFKIGISNFDDNKKFVTNEN